MKKSMYSIHKWTGLLAGLIILLMGITGGILSFHEELTALEFRQYDKFENQSPEVSIDRALTTLTATYPNWDIRIQRFSKNPDQAIVFQLRRPDDRILVFSHPGDGSILKSIPQSESKVYWLLKLHYALHSGLFGETIIFICGCAFVLSLLTGFWVYRKSIVKTLLFKTRFNSQKKRAKYSALHRYVGVWALLFNLLMALTGAVISYEVIKYGYTKPSAASLPETPDLTISVDRGLEKIGNQYPGLHPAYIRMPVVKGAPVIVAVKQDDFTLHSKYYTTISLDPQTGEPGPLTRNYSLSSLVRGIHFIEFGNWLVKLLFFLVGLSGPILSITGFLLWKMAKKKVAN